jgi:hypothetical protein
MTKRRGLRWAWVAGLILALGLPARADDPVAEKITLFTAVAEAGDQEKFPEELKAYKNSLIKVAKRFRLAATKRESLTAGKTTKIDLPEKLGVAEITWDGKSASIKILRDGKVVSTSKSNSFPTIIVEEKLKAGGQQVVLILDKGHK